MRPRTNLDRHTIDLIARAVVSGRRGHGKRVDRTADFIAGLMSNKLEAAGAKGAIRSRRSRPPDTSLQDRQILDLLLRRTEKHLASSVLVESGDGGPYSR